MFYIGFTSGPRVDAEGWRHAAGELTLGDASERFEADLRFWSMAQYEHQWRRAAALLLGGAPRAAFLTSYRGPGAGYHSMWSAWREGGTLYLQEQLVLTEQLPVPFNPDTIEQLVGTHQTVNDEGQAISEWSVPLGQLVPFVADE